MEWPFLFFVCPFFVLFGSFCLDFAMVVYNEGDGLDKVNCGCRSTRRQKLIAFKRQKVGFVQSVQSSCEYRPNWEGLML
ncbi:uncharacterized protein B0T23DRAFT_385301 [Neurospora hispaniola]|uniref:Secreted protein n=1 Tax=Neurospora hispaniola TaxID=588809 RepID=A0AAJ0I4L8_9PEZI|nr:hypothetical protein B0T23DRAFT_385301 [Neurospora hispaniola]